MNHYDVLGVPQNASQDEIRRAYRAQIKFFHPDVFQGSESVAQIKTQQLNEAYSVLGNPESRRSYDFLLAQEEEKKRAYAKQEEENRRRAEAERRRREEEELRRRAEEARRQKEAAEAAARAAARVQRRKEFLQNRFLPFVAGAFAVSCIWFFSEASRQMTDPATTAKQETVSNVDSGSNLTYWEWKQHQLLEETMEKKNPKEAMQDLKDKYGSGDDEQKKSPDEALEEWKKKYGSTNSIDTTPDPVFYRNGEIIKSPSEDRLCPLSVEAGSGQAYYVYLDCVHFSSCDMSFMVAPGGIVDIDVPIGRYEIYYATGDKWHGEELLFGEDTQHYKCEGTFDFYEEDGYYNGWTLELYQQAYGNMDTDAIAESEFPG